MTITVILKKLFTNIAITCIIIILSVIIRNIVETTKATRLLRREARILLAVEMLMDEDVDYDLKEESLVELNKINIEEIMSEIKKIVGDKFFVFNVQKRILNSSIPFINYSYKLCIKSKMFEKKIKSFKLSQKGLC